MGNKQCVVIGLGSFGSSVARTLYASGNDVLAIDSDEVVVQEISDYVTKAVQLDAVDENALRSLGLRNFDVAIIAIGSIIQSSIIVTLIVKELGVKYIIAKADNDLHAKILYKIGADKVVFPEKDMGTRVAHNLFSSNILDYIELSSDYCINEIISLEEWHGKTLRELNLPDSYDINVIAIKRNDAVNVSPSANDIIYEGDIVVVIGDSKALSMFENNYKMIK